MIVIRTLIYLLIAMGIFKEILPIIASGGYPLAIIGIAIMVLAMIVDFSEPADSK